MTTITVSHHLPSDVVLYFVGHHAHQTSLSAIACTSKEFQVVAEAALYRHCVFGTSAKDCRSATQFIKTIRSSPDKARMIVRLEIPCFESQTLANFFLPNYTHWMLMVLAPKLTSLRCLILKACDAVDGMPVQHEWGFCDGTIPFDPLQTSQFPSLEEVSVLHESHLGTFSSCTTLRTVTVTTAGPSLKERPEDAGGLSVFDCNIDPMEFVQTVHIDDMAGNHDLMELWLPSLLTRFPSIQNFRANIRLKDGLPFTRDLQAGRTCDEWRIQLSAQSIWIQLLQSLPFLRTIAVTLQRIGDMNVEPFIIYMTGDWGYVASSLISATFAVI